MSFEERASSKPPLEDMSGALKSTLIFLPKTGSGKENNVFCCSTELFVVFLHIEAVCITLIFSTLNVLLFLELHKKYSFFFVNMYSG